MGFSVFLRVAIRLRSAPRWLAFALQILLNQKAPSLLRLAKIRQAIAKGFTIGDRVPVDPMTGVDGPT